MLVFITLLVFTKDTLTSYSYHLMCGSLNKNLQLKLENGQKLYSKTDPKIIIKTTAQCIDNVVTETLQYGPTEKRARKAAEILQSAWERMELLQTW